MLTSLLVLGGIVLVIPFSIRLFQRFVGAQNAPSSFKTISLQNSFWIDNGRRLVSVQWKDQEILLLLSSKGDQVIAIHPKKEEDTVISIKRAEKTA
ncbi:hypothetical protein Bealeia1_00377 [Candidatus Bealeia paramacronuclearis]|uniref:Uncharacterized protein n=1 Tax=Candidatus Bealeia paramacronuclearis TaxID=1921001 RepID=A0ABZ2C1E8_9PROT|nr:hypothetical protein [Candidatus Bealeia paramacronuclearis]